MKTKTETLKLKINELPPENFTGIVEYPLGTKIWFQDGFPHRVDGPAFEKYNGNKEWWISNMELGFFAQLLFSDRKDMIYLGIEKGKYDLYWLKFLTANQGIQEFPYIKGMETEKLFVSLFEEFLTEKEMKEIGL